MACSERSISTASMRLVILQALGLAAVGGCSDRPMGPESGSVGDAGTDATGEVDTTGEVTSTGSSGTSSTSSTSGTSSTSSTTASTTSTTASTTVDTGPDQLPCQPQNSWEGVICLPKEGDACGPCDEACLQSPQAAELAEDWCCFFESSALCGPAESETECCYVISIDGCGCDGRPLRIDGVRRVALASSADASAWLAADRWTDLGVDAPAGARALAGARWLAAALDEHASIAAFARLVLELIGLAAPAELIFDAQAALADEVAHARGSFAVAAALSGRACGPGPLADATAGALAGSLRELGLAAFVDGCVGEGIAAARAAAAARACDDPRLRALLEGIAADELRHAALAWRVLRWALEVAGPTEARALRRGLLGHLAAIEGEGGIVERRDADGDTDALARLGCLGAASEAGIADAVGREVIAPCLRALLDGAPRAAEVVAVV